MLLMFVSIPYRSFHPSPASRAAPAAKGSAASSAAIPTTPYADLPHHPQHFIKDAMAKEIADHDEKDWEAKYNELKAIRQKEAIARWEDLQDQFPDYSFHSPDGTMRPGKKVIKIVQQLFSLTMMESFQLGHLLDVSDTHPPTETCTH